MEARSPRALLAALATLAMLAASAGATGCAETLAEKVSLTPAAANVEVIN
jgi:hypothetical protein